MKQLKLLTAAPLLAAIALTGCARNPVTGASDVAIISEKGEIEQGRKAHEQIKRAFGVYEDQALQDYVNELGQRLARVSHRPDLEWHFTVTDQDRINAFALPGGYIYIERGIMAYINSEAELASILGHEIGHVTARHSVRQQSQGLATGILATAAAIFTQNRALADLANIGGTALMRGYGREMELEADRLGAQYMSKIGYDPQAVIKMLGVLKNQELFELDRAKAEGRDPQIYHGVFSTHPSADQRLQQAVAVAGSPFIKEGENRGLVGHDEYLNRIDGLPFGTSRAQGIIRENRFYHADMNLTMAFPKDWVVLNQPTRILAHTRAKDALIQFVADKVEEKQTPKEFLEKQLRGRSLHSGESIEWNGMQGYTVVTKGGSPLDGGSGPVRYTALYRGTTVYVISAASRSSQNGLPMQDRIFLSTAQTLRELKPSELPLAEPYRLRMLKATNKTRMADLAKESPLPKYAEAQLRLINDMYPKREPKAGETVKIVE